MIVEVSPLILGFIVGVVVLAGAVNGMAGFGFALVATMVLATVLDPAVAVVFVIIPIVAVNIRLASELSPRQLRRCGRRFWPLVLAALVGTIGGMIFLDVIPEAPLRISLGLISLAFVASVQDRFEISAIERTKSGCFVESVPAMVGVGWVGGLLFGATNVGVQLVAYVRSCDLSHGLFVGVVATIFLGLNAIRVGAAGVLGLYPDVTTLVLSVAAIVPALAGVAIGSRVRDQVPARTRRGVVLGLLTVIGIQLILVGGGIV